MRKWLIAAAATALLVAGTPLVANADVIILNASPTVQFVYPAGTTFTSNYPTYRTSAFGYPAYGFGYSYAQTNCYANYSGFGFGYSPRHGGLTVGFGSYPYYGGSGRNSYRGWGANYVSVWNGGRVGYGQGWNGHGGHGGRHR